MVKMDQATAYSNAKRLEAIFDHALNAMIVIDEKGVVAEFNPEASRLFGYRSSEIIGQNIKILMPDEYAVHHDAYLSGYLETGLSKIIGVGREVVGKRKDGSEFPVFLWVNECVLEEGRTFVGVILDLTERKKYEEELLLAKVRAEEASRAKSNFLASMSHELRTPLNGINGFSEFLLGEHGGPLNADQRKYLENIHKCGEDLLRLITDLLDVSKIDAGAVKLEVGEIAISYLFQLAHTMMQKKAEEKGVTMTIVSAPDLSVQGDLDRCRQILLNLLVNAVKFTSAGDSIVLRATSHDDSFIKISIQDTGIGIEAEELENIFDEFYQAEGERRTTLGGSGIGLAIARRLVALHNGEIGVESVVEEGSTFWFTLPKWKASAGEASETSIIR